MLPTMASSISQQASEIGIHLYCTPCSTKVLNLLMQASIVALVQEHTSHRLEWVGLTLANVHASPILLPNFAVQPVRVIVYFSALGNAYTTLTYSPTMETCIGSTRTSLHAKIVWKYSESSLVCLCLSFRSRLLFQATSLFLQ